MKTEQIDTAQQAYMLYTFYNRMCFVAKTDKDVRVRMAVLNQAFRTLLQAFPEIRLKI